MTDAHDWRVCCGYRACRFLVAGLDGGCVVVVVVVADDVQKCDNDVG